MFGREKFSSESDPAPKDGLIDRVRKGVNRFVEESHLPTKEALGYESTSGVYGGKLVEDDKGRLVMDTRGPWSRLDRWGDGLLRIVDDHQVREPGKMMRRHPGKLIRTLPFVAEAKRFRGSSRQMVANAERLGLGEFYGLHPWGVEIKQPDIYKKSISLQDIYRQDLLQAPILEHIDRFQALGRAAEYIKTIHEKHGGIGEVLVGSALFREHDEGEVKNPVLYLPNIIYNPEKNISEREKMATDLLDFMASIASEEWRRSKEWKSVDHALDILLAHYGLRPVIALTRSFAKRGRLTLPGDNPVTGQQFSEGAQAQRQVFSAHNIQRVHPEKDIVLRLRHTLIEACGRFLDRQEKAVDR